MKKIADRLYRLGNKGLPSYLIIGDDRTALIDSGIAYMGPVYLDEITTMVEEFPALKDGPDYLLFTHSHFDHVGSAPILLKHFPKMEFGAYERLFRVLGRDGAKKSIADLNQKMTKRFMPDKGLDPEELDYSVISDGLALKDGDTLNLGGRGGGITIEVIETPGHTRDSISYFLPHIGAIFVGEAIGIPHGDGPYAAPEFLSSYTDYINSIEKVRAKRPRMIIFGHQGIITGDTIETYLNNAVSDALDLKEKIESYLREEEMDEGRVVNRIKEEEYLTLREGEQPEEAYLLNLTAQVRLLAKSLN